MYDLSTLSRNELRSLLNTANNKSTEYSNCKKEVENCNKRIEDNKKITYAGIGCQVALQYIFCSILVIGGIIILSMGSISEIKGSIGYIFVSAIAFIFFIFGIVGEVGSRKKARRNMEKQKTQLPDLKKREQAAFDRFFVAIEPYKFPREYWYEYAIATMLKFIERQQADNWKELIGLYEEHLHRMRMEDKAQQTLEEIKQQSDDIKKGVNAARWAAAGAWR